MFEFSPQAKMAEQVLRQFCEKEIRPVVRDLDEHRMPPYDLIRKLYDALGIRPMIRAQIEKMIERVENEGGGGELLGGGDPASGGGIDPMMAQIVMKELCRYAPGLALSFGASVGLCGGALLRKGTPEQLRRYAIDVMTFDKIGAWALTEPGAGSDAFGSMKTTARRDGGDWILNGSKTFITNAPYADVFVLYARVVGTGLDRDPIVAFILERGMEGLSTGEPMEKMGMRDSPTGEVFLDDCRVPRNALLGEKEDWGGHRDVKQNLSHERSGAPAMALGIIERCLEESVRYAKQRVQFGQPIADFQAVQHRIARMEIARENVFNLVLKSAWLEKEGKMNAKFACAAKLYSSEAATQVAGDAIMIFGGNGYMKEYPVEKLARDAKLLEIGAGVSEIQLSTIARELYKMYD
ncbi:MAG: acyl-CoA dehydrogenase [Candidatus Dadabacteria bacterium]|nr:MAG: acyl-CoA dehydrogenase [Candidatus Dadabacteria bacterium]